MRGAWKLKAFKWNARRLRGRDLLTRYLSTPGSSDVGLQPAGTHCGVERRLVTLECVEIDT